MSIDTPTAAPELIGLQTLAEEFLISPSSARRYIKSGRLPALRAPGGRLLIKRADALALLTRVEPTTISTQGE